MQRGKNWILPKEINAVLLSNGGFFYQSLPSVTAERKETEKRMTNKEEPDLGYPGPNCWQR